MRLANASVTPLSLSLLIAVAGAGSVLAQPAKDAEWARVTEDDRTIKLETDKLEAVIPKKSPKHWMTGIEKGSFLDKTSGFREIGDGLMVVDWLMEAGSDEAWSEKVIAPDGHGVGRYTWYILGTLTRPIRPGDTTPSWPTAAAIGSGWSRDRSSATG